MDEWVGGWMNVLFIYICKFVYNMYNMCMHVCMYRILYTYEYLYVYVYVHA